MPQGAHRLIKAGCWQREKQDLGTHIHKALWVGCFRVPRLRLDWSIQTKKGNLSSSMGSYLRNAERECPGSQEKMLIISAAGEVLSGTYLFVILQVACNLWHAYMRA